jgi:cyclic-di-GMP-binding protein
MGSKDHSFDAVSEVNMQEVDNAVQQAVKEITTRFDFKGVNATIELDKAEKKITLKGDNEHRMKTLIDILQTKFVKRAVSLKSLDHGKLETGMTGGSVKQVLTIKQGLESNKAKEIVSYIKELKMKVQAQIQEKQVRVQAVKIDDLQAVMAALRKKDFGVDLQFTNFR